MRKDSYSRKDRLIKERRHNIHYKSNKWPEPTLCTECGALFVNGRWLWQEAPEQANKVVCPACRRISDQYPAGYIEIKGSFFDQHRDEVLNLIRNVERQEKTDRPLERVMAIAKNKGHTLVTTTGIHVARRIGEALSRAYKGDFSFRYANGEKSIRVYWQR